MTFWPISTPKKILLRQHGITAIEMLLMLILSITLMALVAQVLQQRMDNSVNATTARQLKTLSRIVQQYVNDHWQEIEYKVTLENEGLYTLPLDKVALPAGFPYTNAYGQGYLIQLEQIQPPQQKTATIENHQGQLRLWVITHGGRAITRRAWQQIGPLLGCQGGYAHSAGLPKIIGFQTEWDTAWLENITRPQAGHLITLQTLHAPRVMSSEALLYRKKISHAPWLNQMKTNLVMGKQQIKLNDKTFKGNLTINQYAFDKENDSITLKSSNTNPTITIKNAQQSQLTLSPIAVTLHSISTFDSVRQKKLDLAEHGSYTAIAEEAPSHLLRSDRIRRVYGEKLPQRAAELHRDWNKIPYHTNFSEHLVQQEAQRICNTDSEKIHKSFGRLFIVGHLGGQAQPQFYICSKKGTIPFAYAFSELVAIPSPLISCQHSNSLSCYSLQNSSADSTITGIQLPKQIEKENKEAARAIFSFLLRATAKIYAALEHNGKADDLYKNLNVQLSRLKESTCTPQQDDLDEFIRRYNFKMSNGLFEEDGKSSLSKRLCELSTAAKHLCVKEAKLVQVIDKIKNFEKINSDIREIVKQQLIDLVNKEYPNSQFIQLLYAADPETNSQTEQLPTGHE